MKLEIDRLCAKPRALRFQVSRACWRSRVPGERDAAVEVDWPLAVEASAYLAGDDVVLEGTLSGSAQAACSRCLARYRHPLREGFRLVLEPAGERVPADPEGAVTLARDGIWLGDELEAGWFRGSQIDLSGFFVEVLALALPVKPLCREECAGLCSRCGADRNSEVCGCDDIPHDSPFAALAALRPPEGPPGGSGSGSAS